MKLKWMSSHDDVAKLSKKIQCVKSLYVYVSFFFFLTGAPLFYLDYTLVT